MRKQNKANARAENLQAAQDRKALRQLGPVPVPNAAPGTNAAAGIPVPQFQSIAGSQSGRGSSIFSSFVDAGFGPNGGLQSARSNSSASSTQPLTNQQSQGGGQLSRAPSTTFSPLLSDSQRRDSTVLSRPASTNFSQLVPDSQRRDSTGPTRQAPSRAELGRLAFSRADARSGVGIPGYATAPSSLLPGGGYTTGPASIFAGYTAPPPPAAAAIAQPAQ